MFIKAVMLGGLFICCNCYVFSSNNVEVSNYKFNTKEYSFSIEYTNLSHHQATFNREIIKKISDTVAKWFPNTHINPIKVLDLCCGHGQPTNDLFHTLESKGVSIAAITGYDISSALIKVAQNNYSDNKKMKFCVQDVEKLEDENEYDLVVSFFGLQWIENIENTARLIAKALKKEGKIVFLVPLEKMDLFAYRESFLKNSQWQTFFLDYKINPFIEDEQIYIKAFEKDFRYEMKDTIRIVKTIKYTNEEFVKFLASWIQEVRHLQKTAPLVDSLSYVKDMVDNLSQNYEYKNINKLEDNSILFTTHLFYYQGSLGK